MEWKQSYTMLLFLVGIIITLFFTQDKIELPRYPFFISSLGMLYLFVILTTDAFRIRGQASLTTLPLERGGHSSINPVDIRLAIPNTNDPNAVKFSVFATGGFSALGFEFKGKEAFCVSPPEYVHLDMEAGLICTTKMRQVDFDDLPDYVQDELRKLHRFNEKSTKTKGNIWFGLTSKEDGTDTAQNQMIERRFITTQQENNFLKETIKELREQDRERRRKAQGFVRLKEVEDA